MKKLRIALPLTTLTIAGIIAIPAIAAHEGTRVFSSNLAEDAAWFYRPASPDRPFPASATPEYAAAIATAFGRTPDQQITTDELRNTPLDLNIAGLLAPDGIIDDEQSPIYNLQTSWPTNIEFLGGLTSLDTSNNRIYDISFLGCMPNLTSLNLSSNYITGLDWNFQEGTEDETQQFGGACVNGNNISNLSALENLDLSNNTYLHDIALISQLPSLRTLNISGTSVPIDPESPQMQTLKEMQCLRNVSITLPVGAEITCDPVEPEPTTPPAIDSHDPIGDTGRTVTMIEHEDDETIQAIAASNPEFAEFLAQLGEDTVYLTMQDREHCREEHCDINITLTGMQRSTTYYVYHHDENGVVTPVSESISSENGELIVDVERFSGNFVTSTRISAIAVQLPDGTTVIIPSTGGAQTQPGNAIGSPLALTAISTIILIAGTTAFLLKKHQKA